MEPLRYTFVVRFGTYEVSFQSGEVRKAGVRIRVQRQPLKGARKPLPQIARELNVDAVVEGTVLRAGDQVRITAQLIEASTDKHLWSQSYEGQLRDTPREQAALKSVRVVKPEAYESYLKGRYFWNKRAAEGLRVALAYFNQAIEEDPNYAQAYSGLADTYALLGDWQYAVMTPTEASPKAKAAALKAVELDSALGEAHNSLAFALDGFDWDLDSGGKEFRRPIELSPGYATAHQWYAGHLTLLGQYDQAIAEMRRRKVWTRCLLLLTPIWQSCSCWPTLMTNLSARAVKRSQGRPSILYALACPVENCASSLEIGN